MEESETDSVRGRVPDRWELLRDALVFQGKLFLDGLRDVAMGPVSVVAALLDFLGLGRRAGLHFYDVLRFGRRTEKWIGLFAAAERPGGPPGDPPYGTSALSAPAAAGVDGMVDRLEALVRQEYERGGITRSAKEAVDRALDRVQGPGAASGEGGREEPPGAGGGRGDGTPRP